MRGKRALASSSSKAPNARKDSEDQPESKKRKRSDAADPAPHHEYLDDARQYGDDDEDWYGCDPDAWLWDADYPDERGERMTDEEIERAKLVAASNEPGDEDSQVTLVLPGQPPAGCLALPSPSKPGGAVEDDSQVLFG